MAIRRRLLLDDPARVVVLFVGNLSLSPDQGVNPVYLRHKDSTGVLNITMDEIKAGG